jgi:putative FmdB family regulatory protein
LPIFEYECAKCKSTFELLTSGESCRTVKCPHCSSRKVAKLFSSFSVGTGRSGSPKDSGASGTCSTCTTKNGSSCG